MAILHIGIMDKVIKIKLEDYDKVELTFLKFKSFLEGFPGKHSLEIEGDNKTIKG